MIKVNGTECFLEGKEDEICAEMGMIFNNLIEEIGINKTKTMVYLALDTVITENMKPQRKEQIIRKKELKKKLREDLPKELAEILCSLL